MFTSQPSDADFSFKCTWWLTRNNKLLLGTHKRFYLWPSKAWSLALRSCNRMLFQLLHLLDPWWNCRTLTLVVTTQEFMGWMMHLQQREHSFSLGIFKVFWVKIQNKQEASKIIVLFWRPWLLSFACWQPEQERCQEGRHKWKMAKIS